MMPANDHLFAGSVDKVRVLGLTTFDFDVAKCKHVQAIDRRRGRYVILGAVVDANRVHFATVDFHKGFTAAIHGTAGWNVAHPTYVFESLATEVASS